MKRIENKSNNGSAPYLTPQCWCTLLYMEKLFCQSTGTEALIEDSDDPWDDLT